MSEPPSPRPLCQLRSSLLNSETRSWSFTVIGEPKGQPRQRHFARKMGHVYVARSYDPGTAEGWKSLIAVAAKDAGLAGLMLDCPLSLAAEFYFQRPKSHFRTGKNAALLRDSAPREHVSKPDLDNIVKAAKDALTQCGVWRDDALVCGLRIVKEYADIGTPAFSRFCIMSRRSNFLGEKLS